MRRLAIVLVVAAVVVGGAWLLLGRPLPGGADTATPNPSIPPVPPSPEVVADGRLVPVRWAELSMPLPGEISEVGVVEGDTVASGQQLIRLDDTAAAAEVDAARGAVATAEAGVARAEAAEAQAAAQVEAARDAVTQARAGVSAARAARDALPSGASSAQKRAAAAEIDAAEAALGAARANATAAAAARDGAAAGVDAAKGELARAVAGRSVADAALADHVLAAPFAGVVASLDARVGELAPAGAPLVRIADPSAGWRIETSDLDETTVARVPEGAPVTITFDGLPGVTVEGTVVSVALFGADVQGDVVYRAVVEPATLPDGIRWNMTATVTVATGE